MVIKYGSITTHAITNEYIGLITSSYLIALIVSMVVLVSSRLGVINSKWTFRSQYEVSINVFQIAFVMWGVLDFMKISSTLMTGVHNRSFLVLSSLHLWCIV